MMYINIIKSWKDEEGLPVYASHLCSHEILTGSGILECNIYYKLVWFPSRIKKKKAIFEDSIQILVKLEFLSNE